jgi:hypothetical protein
MPAMTTRRGSFAGAGLAFSAKVLQRDVASQAAGSPGTPCVCQRAAARSSPGASWDEAAAVRGGDFGQLGARAGDELVDLYPGSGAITEALRRCTGVLRVTGDVGEVDARRVASSGMCAPAERRYDVAVVG